MASIEELNILLERIRHHDDYRSKIFGFYVTLNGVLISFLKTLYDSKGSFISLYLFAFVASIFGLMNSIRSTIITDKYRVAAVDLEKDLGFTHLYAVHN